MTTDLVHPAWSYTITTSDGGSAVTPGFYNQTLDLSGIILSYKGQGSEVMSVALKGTTSSGEYTCFCDHPECV